MTSFASFSLIYSLIFPLTFYFWEGCRDIPDSSLVGKGGHLRKSCSVCQLGGKVMWEMQLGEIGSLGLLNPGQVLVIAPCTVPLPMMEWKQSNRDLTAYVGK